MGRHRSRSTTHRSTPRSPRHHEVGKGALYPDTLLPFLRELALKRGGNKLVFPGEDHKPRSKPGVRFPFKQAASRAALPDALRFHDLRHTFASHWVLDGGDIWYAPTLAAHFEADDRWQDNEHCRLHP